MSKNRFQNLMAASFIQKMEQEKEGILLDVRTSMEYDDFHLEDSINIDIKNRDFIDEINELEKDKHYFIYCRIGVRSSNACNYMAMLGFKNLYNLKGGIITLETIHDES
ncbi:MAG: rhodanese-like domain-containing protein [Chitinophagales bacterium]